MEKTVFTWGPIYKKDLMADLWQHRTYAGFMPSLWIASDLQNHIYNKTYFKL